MTKEIKTDWDNVAQWYDNYLIGEDTYQAKVIAPNLLRMVAVKKGNTVLDVACGQGYFARQVAATGASVTGIDQSAVLINKANTTAGSLEKYIVGNAEKLGSYQLGSFDTIFSVLALENIKNAAAVLEGMNNLLKKNGKVVLVMLHPAFRIPQHADWGYDIKKEIQYRKVEKYLSEITIPIELMPFNGGKKITTTTFHRSLQWYMKTFRAAGFAISSLEEWNSHKKSAPGPRQKAEDAARKEIPMFLALELKKV
jgi:ubiquinone/menaquinone biosynthesis C-methylase UbiE